jgi:hypothetical protein
MRRLAALAAVLLGSSGCTGVQDAPIPLANPAPRVAPAIVVTSASPAAASPVSAAPPCAIPPGPLDPAAIAAAPLPDDAGPLAAALGLDCAVDAPGFDVALAQAVARFQQRYGRYADEVTGRVDERTRRQLEMIYPALRGADHPCAVAADASVLPACLLRWPGASEDELAFMRRVYDEAGKRAALRRPFAMAADDVDVIERGPCPGRPDENEPECRRTHLAQRDAARAAGALLAAARALYDGDRQRYGQSDLMVYTGYRSAPFQLEIWEYHFPARYRATQAARERLPGGAHGQRAAEHLAAHYAARTAAPGFSLHGRGLAIDFGCVTKDGGWIGSNGSFVAAWKSSHCFQWMKANASRFGFRLNPNIDEPWHWEYVGAP